MPDFGFASYQRGQMRRRALRLVGIVILSILMVFSVAANYAQDTPVATAEPPAQVEVSGDTPSVDTQGGDVEISGGGDTTVTTDIPEPLQPLAAFSVGVFGFLELLKAAFLSNALGSLDDKQKAAVYFLLSAVIAFLVLFFTRSTLDVTTLLGYAPPVDSAERVVHYVITAFASAGGSALWHVLYEFRKRVPTAART